VLMKSKFGLVFGLAAEARKVLGRKSWEWVQGRPAFRTHLDDGTFLVAVQSGVGEENASSATDWLISEGVSAIAAMGLCGGLDPSLRTGDLVVASDLLRFDGGERAERWTTDADFVRHARAILTSAGLTVRSGAVVTTRSALFTAGEKGRVFRQTGALAVDMESAAVARAAVSANLPVCGLRAICDPGGKTVPGEFFDCVDHRGLIRYGALFHHLAMRPSLLRALVPLAEKYAAALRSLKRAWSVLIKNRLPAHMMNRDRQRGS
jgi:adenosylhomocysteine nucleosidase